MTEEELDASSLASAIQSGSGSTKRLEPVFGRTTAYFTWSIHGAKRMNFERSSNSDLSLWRVTRISPFRRSGTFNVDG